MNRILFFKTLISSYLFLQIIAFSQSAASQQQIFDPSILQPISCPAGASSEMFSLVTLNYPSPTPQVLKTLIPGVTGQIQAKDAMSLRLDICWDPDTGAISLKRVLFHSYSYGPIDVYSEGDSKFLNITHLDNVVFGSPDGFNLLVRGKNKHGVLVRGMGEAPEKRFVAAVGIEFPTQGNSYRLTQSEALIGTIEVGDAFSGGPCKIGTTFTKSQVILEKASLTFDLCTFLGGGETTGYTIEKVVVNDRDPLIPEAQRGLDQVFEKETLKSALRYQYNHHNACDSFVLTVPALNSVYAATSSPSAGCGSPVSGAPIRQHDETGPNVRKAIFRIDYKGQPGMLKALEQPHFLRLY